MAMEEARSESGAKSGLQDVAQPADRRRFTVALLFSLCVLMVGMIWTWRVGQESNKIFHHLFHAREALDGLRASLGQHVAHTEGIR